MRHTPILLLLALAGLASGCGDNGNPSTDDSGTSDVDTDDQGTEDGGDVDAYVNPCATNNGGCDPLTICVDMQGVASCGACPTGYLRNGMMACEVDACFTANGGCDVLRLCASMNAEATCGACVEGYKEDGMDGCEVDACVTDNGGCAANRLCESAGGVATCGECEFGYDDDGMDGCTRNACTLARVDTYEPDGFFSPVLVTLTAEPMTLHRSLTGTDTDYFWLRVSAGCELHAQWTHEGVTGDATYYISSPAYGVQRFSEGPFSETGTATVAASVAAFNLDYNFIIEPAGLCASYSLTAFMTCPAP